MRPHGVFETFSSRDITRPCFCQWTRNGAVRRFDRPRKTKEDFDLKLHILLINRIDACLEGNALETFETFWCLNQYCPQGTSSLFSIRRLQDLSRWINTWIGLIRVVMEKRLLKLRNTESMNEGCSKLVRNRRAIAMKRFPVSTLRFFFFPIKNEFSYTKTKEMSSALYILNLLNTLLWNKL